MILPDIRIGYRAMPLQAKKASEQAAHAAARNRSSVLFGASPSAPLPRSADIRLVFWNLCKKGLRLGSKYLRQSGICHHIIEPFGQNSEKAKTSRELPGTVFVEKPA